MPELLKGRISDVEGLREVLEIIETFKEVNSSVLEIQTPTLSGKIGIAWGRFITGASLLETGADEEQKGRKPLRRLLRLREGKFRFIDLEGEPVEELRQSLGVDLHRTSTVVPALDYKEAHFLYELSESPDAYTEPLPGSSLPADPGVQPAPAVEQQQAEPKFHKFMDDFASALDVDLTDPVPASQPPPTGNPQPPQGLESQYISEPQFGEAPPESPSFASPLIEGSLEDLIHSQSQTVSPQEAVQDNSAQMISTPLDAVFGGPMRVAPSSKPVDFEETQPMFPVPEPEVNATGLRSQWTGPLVPPQIEQPGGLDHQSESAQENAQAGWRPDDLDQIGNPRPADERLQDDRPTAGGLRSKFTAQPPVSSPFIRHTAEQSKLQGAEAGSQDESSHTQPPQQLEPPEQPPPQQPAQENADPNRRQIPFLRMTGEQEKLKEEKTLVEPIQAIEPASPPAPSPSKKTPLLKPGVVAGPSLSADQVVQTQPRLRPKPARNNDAVGIAIFCVLFFVVSCAGTVIFGPKAWAIITSLLHLQ